MKHTPTPWKVQSGMICANVDTVQAVMEIGIAKMDREEPNTSPTERDANLNFIVEACNSYARRERIAFAAWDALKFIEQHKAALIGMECTADQYEIAMRPLARALTED